MVHNILTLFTRRQSIVSAIATASAYSPSSIRELISSARILYSYDEGDRSIASKHHFNEVYICDKTTLKINPIGKFYIEKFICEFEYLYQMAISSIMPESYVNELSTVWKYEKELVVLRFLQGIFVILNENMESYDNEDIELFKNFFCKDDLTCCKPYRRMLQSFVSVMKNKIQSAEKNKSKNINKLREILFEAKALEQKSIDYFSEKLGESDNYDNDLITDRDFISKRNANTQ